MVRIAGVLVENGKLLLVKQQVTANRRWALPGGRQERGERGDQCIVREIKEETGLDVKAKGLLYITDRILNGTHVVHISFQLERTQCRPLPDSWIHEDPFSSASTTRLREVKMVPFEELTTFGFDAKFRDLIKADFPGCGSYQGDFVKFYGGA